ncbi:hypothetical protein Chor_004141 [Crotalus horridus]
MLSFHFCFYRKSLSKGSTRSKMSIKSAKMYSSLQKVAVLCDPKPQQVKKVFEALKKGLNEYLEMHQMELDYLSECHRDRRRNSRLGFYYDLDKQIRSVERYIRKLEFQISKIEELYEAYSIQCRLRDGASNMKHAFSLSPSTKASRESLVELYKNLQECTEDMCLIEGTLEVHLGEFHLKMKGLVGYARLCPGDQYEVTELRGLSTVLVGTVTCDSIEFFTTRPQTIIVDITELGTIKLQLEVLWNPFDSENLILSPGSTTKFSVGSRKNSIYSWTPPNTPSFREKYYLKRKVSHDDDDSNFDGDDHVDSVLQQGKKHANIREETQDSCILSYLADCDFNMRLRSVSHSLTETTEGSSFSSEDQKVTESRNITPPSNERKLPLAILQNNCAEGEEQDISICQSPGHRTLDILQETPYAETSLTIPSYLLEQDKDGGKTITRDWHHPTVQQTKILSVEQRDWNDNDDDAKTTGKTKSIQKILQEVLKLLKSQCPSPVPLEELEYQVFCIQDKLKPKKYPPKHSSMESLMVETVLESFDFLNADCSADELSSFGSVRTCSTSIYNDATLSSLCCDAHMEKELTTGSDDLDRLLEIHLQLCRILLQKLLKPNLAPIVQENLLKEVSQQKHVLEIISALATPVPRKITSVEEIIQKAQKPKHCLKIWSECTEQGSILFCPAERFWIPLKYILMFKTKEKYRHHLEKVLQVFLEQIVGGILLGNSRDLPAESVTLFQFYSYLEKHHVNNLEKYLIRFAKEVILTEDLQRPGRMKKIKKLKGKQLNQLEPLPQTLRLLAVLQLDENHRIGKAAILCLSRAATNRNFREKALPFYTDLLSNDDAKLQQAACLALKNLKIQERRIDGLASFDSKSEGREKGRLAFEKMDKICCDLREAMYQEADIEITIF